MSAIQTQDAQMEKSKKKRITYSDELTAEHDDGKHLARILSRKRAQNRAA
jgi:hypothetical protein